jgi:hypothetical protein
MGLDYIKLLKDCNLKLTPQRLAIIEVLNTNGHMSVDDLYTILLEKFPSISLATIYKNVNAMRENSFSCCMFKIPYNYGYLPRYLRTLKTSKLFK